MYAEAGMLQSAAHVQESVQTQTEHQPVTEGKLELPASAQLDIPEVRSEERRVGKECTG